MKTIGNKAALMKSLMAISPVKTIRDDEFTMDDYFAMMRENGDTRSYEGLRSALQNDERNGKFKSRKVVVNGKECNAYSIATS